MRRNIESILGPNPLLWCCPSRTPGSGLKYELTNNDGELVELSDPQSRDSSHDLA
jgi:1,4-alpha-glucan branching enzyme